MSLTYSDYELPLLQALIKLGGYSKPSYVYPIVENIMKQQLEKNPDEYGTYKRGEIIWKNRTQFARKYLKRKGQLDGSEWGVWKITQSGRERVRIFKETNRDSGDVLA